MAYKTELIQFKCRPEDKEKLQKEAEEKRIKLTDLIRKKLKIK